ncbi:MULTISPECIES: hypothetical protein [Brevibacillus]|uniref:hypothetical protein n=1 Tax=Brevibacillus TaxID=55080 RepID=UPI000ECAF76D|nr:hypothetical protein [Brevibacillus sp.]HBZ80244.1 hypothetical protein [Brevibacillus sp.]
MYLEEEVYGMLNWGFAIVMGIQLIWLVSLKIQHKFNKEVFGWLLAYIVFFALAGYKLLEAINTFEMKHPMGSENASASIGMSGILWTASVFCLFFGLSRLLSNRKGNGGEADETKSST